MKTLKGSTAPASAAIEAGCILHHSFGNPTGVYMLVAVDPAFVRARSVGVSYRRPQRSLCLLPEPFVTTGGQLYGENRQATIHAEPAA